jgi:DNA-binding beta-propeller fold protein YncE
LISALWKLAALAGAILMLGAASTASAETYEAKRWTKCPDNKRNGGSYDGVGRVYIACGEGKRAFVLVLDANGQKLREIKTRTTVSDVAATADAGLLYLARGAKTTLRLKREGGKYLRDPSWDPEPYPTYPGSDPVTPTGHFIATDAAGDVYVADGAAGGRLYHRVLRYEADGDLQTQFGDYSSNGAQDRFISLHGLAVTPDGSQVFTADGASNSRIVRWDEDGGTYEPSGFALGAIGEFGCGTNTGGGLIWDDKLASPYDVALDTAGDLYVLNTTCHEVLRFRHDGTFVTGNRVGAEGKTKRPHGFAVGADGARIYVAHSNRRLRLLP